jgi:GT2 family glycosyltransferase
MATGMEAPAVSVVVPDLDSPWIGATLAALRAEIDRLRQERADPPPVELLVVGQDAHGLVSRHEAVRFLETPQRLNPAAARNLGVTLARGRRLLFTDADCAPRRGWISHLTRTLETSPVAGGAVTFDLDAGYWAAADNIASFHELLPDRPAEPDTRAPLGSLNLALTRDAWDTVGPFDEDLTTSEDLDWVLRARAAGLTTAFVPEALVEHAAVREDRAALERHATWYGEHFDEFRRRHPGVFDRGPTWRSRRLLALTAPVKSWTSALGIFQRHRWLPWKLLPGVVAFKRAWYRAVVRGWSAGTLP